MVRDIVQLGGQRTVRRLGLGTIEFTGKGVWGRPESPEQCIDVLRAAVTSGVNFVDTAHAYGPGVAEELIARALHPYPDDLLIATKGGFSRPGRGAWVVDGQPSVLRRQIDESLRRLRTDSLGLWQLHRIDSKVPLDEQLGVVVEAQRAGKIQLFGLSKVDATQIAQTAESLPVASVQNRLNASDRSSEAVVDFCHSQGIVFIAWAPHAVGGLARPGVESLEERFGLTASQLALGWLLQRAPNIIAIPGTTSLAHLAENLATFRLWSRDVPWLDYLRLLERDAA